MTAPLSGKQKRENMKFLLDQLRETAGFRKEQRRKDALAQQNMSHKEQSQQAKMANMSVPPKMTKPTNPEAGPNDKIPALLAPGEAVIPAKAAQKPENKPLIKAMVREGRSDRNLSVPMPKGFMCGTDKVKGYELGTTYVDEFGNYSDYIMSQQPGIVPEPTPRSVVVVDTPPQTIVNPNVPVQSLNETDNAVFTRGKESSNNFNIGYHNPEKSSAFGAYGLTEAAYKDIQKADPYFAKKPITELSADEQTTAFKVYENVLADQLKAKEIEPTTSNLRGAYLLGAEGLKNWQTKGELSKEAIEANGGRDKLISIIKDRTGTGIQRVADKVLTAVSGSANAAEVPKPAVVAKEESAEPVLLNDPNIVPEPEASKLDSVPQGAYAQQEDYLKSIPKEGGTDQQKALRDQVIPEDKTILGNYYDFGKEAIVDGLTAIGNNIKDPKVLTNNIKSFITDTLGFTGGDAAKFATLYLAQRAMGVSERGASLYAGKYMLQSSDARAAREQQHISSMEQKGYIYNPKTKKFSPGSYKPTGELKNITFDQGGLSGQTFSYRTNKRGGDGAEEMFIEGTNIPISTLVELNKRDPKELIDAKDPSRGTVGEALNKIKARYTSGSMRAAGAGDTPDAVAKRVTDVAKSIDFEKKLNQQLPITKEASNRSTNAEIRSRLPDTETMRSNVIVAANKHGVKLSNEREVAEFNQVANNAIDDAIRHAASSKDKTLNVEAFIDNAIMLHSEGISNEMYKDPSGKKMNPSEIKTQMASLFKAYEGDRAAAIKDMVKWQQEYNTNESLRDKYQGFTHSTGKTGQSGFYMYVQSEILKKQKKN